MHTSVDTACKESHFQAPATFCLYDNPLCENGKAEVRRRKGLTCSCSGNSNLELDSKAKNKKCNCGHFQLHLPPHFTPRNQRVWFAFPPPSPPPFEVQVNLISTVGFTAIVTLAPPAPASSQFRPWLTQENKGRSFLTKAPLVTSQGCLSSLPHYIGPSCFSGSKLTTDLPVPAFIGKLNKYV